jgi:hypothetical protein
MKALTLTQPWATLIAIGAKCIETRSWSTGHRGPLAIHAAKTLSRDVYPRGDEDFAHLCNTEPFATALINAGYHQPGGSFQPEVPSPFMLPRGVIVAVAHLERVTQMTERGIASLAHLHPTEHAFGYYEPGRWAWVLREPRPLTVPIQARGAQGLWDWTVEDPVHEYELPAEATS